LKKRFLILAITLVLAVAVPLVIAQIAQQTQNVHVSGTTKYPRNISPTSTPTPTLSAQTNDPPATVQFALFFPNGTSCPTTLTNLPCNVYGPLDSVGGIPATTELVVKNTGSVPINLTVSASNVKVPSNIQFNLAGDFEFNPIEVGGSANLFIAINMVTTNTNFIAGTSFGYSFDIGVTASQG
jgi:hypothetical protein